MAPAVTPASLAVSHMNQPLRPASGIRFDDVIGDEASQTTALEPGEVPALDLSYLKDQTVTMTDFSLDGN